MTSVMLSLPSCKTASSNSPEKNVYAVPHRMTIPAGTTVRTDEGLATLPDDVEAVTLDRHLTRLAIARGETLKD